MTVVSRESAPHYTWGDGCDGWHLVQTDELSIIHERVPPGGSETRHWHRWSEQFFFVLSGVATFELDGEVHRIPVHHGLHVPPGVPHRLWNADDQDLVFLVTSTPSHGDRVEMASGA